MALMVLGLSLGQVRHEDSDWTKFLLADGREIGIAPTTKADETAKNLLLAEKRNGRHFTNKDEPINIDGARVTFLSQLNQFFPAQPRGCTNIVTGRGYS